MFATHEIFVLCFLALSRGPHTQLMAVAQLHKPRGSLDSRRALPFLPGSDWRSVKPARGNAENFPGTHRSFCFSVAF